MKVFFIQAMKNEIIIYQSDELTERIEVKLEDETVWLNQEQMASWYRCDSDERLHSKEDHTNVPQHA